MTWREIVALFAQMEQHLIRSLKRNLQTHRDEEKEEGFNWPAWQAEKLAAIDKYRRQNLRIANLYRRDIVRGTEELLQEQYNEASEPSMVFDTLNTPKIDSLIEEMVAKESVVSKAAVRYMDDVYRKTIHKSSLFLASGSMTLQQATDLATKDFLRQGINCIRYSNGRVVNIASYAEMALRTANTRAMLIGEAKRREALGIDTVLVSQYGACSKTCLPWQGKVYIDDVFGTWNGRRAGNVGQSMNDNWYMLLSVAIEAGLYHPNCKHTHTTWQEGISTLPPKLDEQDVLSVAKLEAKQREFEREVRKYKRLEEGSQAPQNIAKYKKKRIQAQRALAAFIKENSGVLRRDYWRERMDGTAHAMVADGKPPRKLFVTEERIENVKSMNQSAIFSKDDISKLVDINKNLLREAAKKHLGTEIAEVYNMSMERVEHIVGVQGGLGLKIPIYDFPHIVVHNHPSGGLFSYADIKSFLSSRHMSALVAVGHNGTVYVLEKTGIYEHNRANSFLLEMTHDYPGYNRDFDVQYSLMEVLLNEGNIESFGIRYYHT